MLMLNSGRLSWIVPQQPRSIFGDAHVTQMDFRHAGCPSGGFHSGFKLGR